MSLFKTTYSVNCLPGKVNHCVNSCNLPTDRYCLHAFPYFFQGEGGGTQLCISSQKCPRCLSGIQLPKVGQLSSLEV